MTVLALIAAVARNGVIGEGNTLPWRLPADMQRFRALTTGHSVIMGRKTWESIGRPLPHRQNIVVTRQRNFVADGALVTSSLDEALRSATMPSPVFCIGGGELYALALPRATTLHLHGNRPGICRRHALPRDRPVGVARDRAGAASAPEGFDYAFVTYERR